MKTFISKFRFAWPMYIMGIIISLVYFWALQNKLTFIFCIIGPAFHVFLMTYKHPFEKVLKELFQRTHQASLEPDLIKKEIKMYVAANKNAAICALYAKNKTVDAPYWKALQSHYLDMAKSHREEAFKLMVKNPNWKTI